MVQVRKEHYTFDRYVGEDRWSSYYHQLKEVLSLKPERVLEIGVGDGVFGSYIKNKTPISYTGVDLDSELQPEITADITHGIPLPDDSVDVVCAFEILEHLPFEKFESVLIEMKRVSKKYVVISLPHFGPQLRMLLKVPLLPLMRIAYKIRYPKNHVFNGEHYWEIGKKGYPLKDVKKIFTKYFIIQKDFVPFNSQYHHFFILKKR